LLTTRVIFQETMPSAPSKILEQLPERIDRPSAWTAATMRDTPDAWLYRLGEDEVAELEAAANHFLALGIDLGRISRDSFPLLARISHRCNGNRPLSGA